MKALVYTGPGRVEMQEVGAPTAQPGERIVQVAAAGICGSEVHGIRTPGFRVPPLVMGHEFAGVTADGARVVVNPILSCRACDRCLAGQRQVCRGRRLLGVHCPGGFADRVAVPSTALVSIPDAVGFQAAALIEPLANAVHAWNLARPALHARIGIIGAGAIGLMCLAVARAAGSAQVQVADLSAHRRLVADTLGASASTDNLEGEFDVVIDAVGAAATRRAAVAHLRPGGTAVLVGLLEAESGFDTNDLIRAEKRLLGSFGYTDAEFGTAIELVTELDLSWVAVRPLDEGPALFADLLGGRTDLVKVVLQP